MLTREIKEALLAACEAYGVNGKGEGGLVGYLYRVCDLRPDLVAYTLLKVMQMQKDDPKPKEVYRTPEEFDAALKARGLPTLSQMYARQHPENPYDRPEEQPETYLEAEEKWRLMPFEDRGSSF